MFSSMALVALVSFPPRRSLMTLLPLAGGGRRSLPQRRHGHCAPHSLSDQPAAPETSPHVCRDRRHRRRQAGRARSIRGKNNWNLMRGYLRCQLHVAQAVGTRCLLCNILESFGPVNVYLLHTFYILLFTDRSRIYSRPYSRFLLYFPRTPPPPPRPAPSFCRPVLCLRDAGAT